MANFDPSISVAEVLSLHNSGGYITPIAPRPPRLYISTAPSSPAKYLRSTRNLVKTTISRTKLLETMNTYLESNLREIDDVSDPFIRIDVFSKTFQLYIEESVIYCEILTRIKREYDTTIENLKEKVSAYTSFDEDLKCRDDRHASDVASIQFQAEMKEKELSSRIKSLESAISGLKSENKKITSEFNSEIARHDTLRNEYLKMKNTSLAMASSLSSSEEQIWQLQIALVSKESEINDYKGSALKLTDEINNLQQTIQVN